MKPRNLNPDTHTDAATTIGSPGRASSLSGSQSGRANLTDLSAVHKEQVYHHYLQITPNASQ
jgi:hypothetical protein